MKCSYDARWHLFKSLQCFHSCLNMFWFIHHWKNKLKVDWVYISAEWKTYLVSLIASLVFKANGIFEVCFCIEMLSKFHTSLFSTTNLRDSLGPRLLWFFELKDSSKTFCCSPADQRSKDHCRRRYKCTCNNSTRESETLRIHSVKATF